MIEYPLFNSIPEIKDNKLGWGRMRKRDIINNVKTKKIDFLFF